MTKFLSFSVGILAMGLASQASAVTISFQYDGTTSMVLSQQSVTATAFYNNLPALSADALTYQYTPAADFTDGFGTVSLAGGTIDFQFEGSYTENDVTGGIVKFKNGSGSYAGYEGMGHFAHSIIDGNLIAGSFDAEIAPVPEPATLMALGVGAASLVRRRRAGKAVR